MPYLWLTTAVTPDAPSTTAAATQNATDRRVEVADLIGWRSMSWGGSWEEASERSETVPDGCRSAVSSRSVAASGYPLVVPPS